MTGLSPSGIITLTTDFGLRDPFVGIMKGRILARFPVARIIDLTHDVSVHAPAEAGFWLERSFVYFPAGTVHVAVVDPGVGTTRDILCAAAHGQYFLAPDNGLLGTLLARATSPAAAPAVVRLQPGALAGFGIGAPSATFHGRDIFAPVAALLASAACEPHQLGRATDTWQPGSVSTATTDSQGVRGCIVTIDHFGNLITNIEGTQLAGFHRPEVLAADRSLPLRRTYGDAAPGELLALVNAFEVLEIACVNGSAAVSLALERGAAVRVRESAG
jgi:S-adenosyl-L-methionine hydrolase (adenosine-forming)